MFAPRRRPGSTGPSAWHALWTCLGLILAAPAAAAEQPVRQNEIVVTAASRWLQVPPERTLDSDDVAAYGIDTVGEIMAQLATEEGDQEEAAYLVNGRRVHDLASVSSLPAEAIVRVEVLPRGAGVSAGARPGQRVVNIALRRTLNLASLRAGARVATEGGWKSGEGELGYTWIQAQRRINLTGKLRNDAMLLESARGIVQPASSPPAAGSFRSLVPSANRLDLTLSASDELTSWLSGSLTSRLALSGRTSRLGPFAPAGLTVQPLEQAGRTLLASNDLTLNGQAGAWQLGLFANHIYSRSRTSTDRIVFADLPPVPLLVRSTMQSIGGQLSAFGPLATVPAGQITLSLNAGGSRDTIEGTRLFQGATMRTSATLTSSTLTAALDIPITRSGGPLPGRLGDLSASLEYGRQHVSDFGSFSNYRISMLWRPISKLAVSGLLSRSNSAPPVATLDAPVIETPGVRYFDPVRNETVDVTLLTGGTPALSRQRDEIRRLAVAYNPVPSLGLRLTTEYSEFRQRNATAEFPSPSSIIIQVFPNRFSRDVSGRLVAVDARAVSFPSRVERQLRTGLLLDLPLGRSGGRVASVADEEEAAGSRGADMRGSVRPRLQLSAAHTWLISSELVAQAGQAPINLLSRDAVGLGGLGQPRHRFDASLAYAERGLGLRLSLQSRGTSFIEASGLSPNTLRFSPLTTFSLSAWARGERLAPRSPLMRGVRLNVALLNVSGARERVTDRFGVTPLSYQSAYRDPVGRSIEISLRKTF